MLVLILCIFAVWVDTDETLIVLSTGPSVMVGGTDVGTVSDGLLVKIEVSPSPMPVLVADGALGNEALKNVLLV